MPPSRSPSGNAGRGRPTLCTPETTARIVAAIRAGATHEAAAGAVGVHRSTLQDWKARGEAGEAPYSDFCAELKRAHDEGQVHLVALIQRAAAAGDWKAAAWLLERRHRDEYGRQVTVDLAAQSQGAAALLAKLTDES